MSTTLNPGAANTDTHVVVIGAGHAGCEAALAIARLGARVSVVTLRRAGIAQMSCNPAVGGVGKGHLVREIDALGGAMAEVADQTAIQCRRLNTSRGPAVRATRVQVDSARYKEAMAARLYAEPLVSVMEGEAVDLRRLGKESGFDVTLRDGRTLRAGAVVVTTGTFLRATCHRGSQQTEGGRVGDAAANFLPLALQRLGVTLGRFKTGTTPRLAADSIRWHALQAQWGDQPRPTLSFAGRHGGLPQIACAITHTNANTHRIVQENLHESPLYSGIISGRGPRYCPSLEDKVTRFSDKPSHQLFLEPEGLTTERIYPAGLSTSLSPETQLKFLRSIEGLEEARILQPGYAVEYDYAPPDQMNASLMAKASPGLFLAGQINGTSGYEEAAAQGLMAGINAVRYLRGEREAIVTRSEGYIGVLIDDLVTKGVDEPYRMFCSRAEHRLTLRESSAEWRLAPRGQAWGVLSPQRAQAAEERLAQWRQMREALQTPFGAERARALGLSPSEYAGKRCEDVLRMPQWTPADLLGDDVSGQVADAVDEEVKFSGYIEREARFIERMNAWEDVTFPPALCDAPLSGLSSEVRDKLARVRPVTLGQASRIPGMTPAAMALLEVAAKRRVYREAVA